MEEVTAGVVKKSAVKTTNPRRIDEAVTRPPGGMSAKARIVEQSDAGAVIEVTCACGKTTHLACSYAEPAS